MTWTLAIDFGTTATAAAIYDGDAELIHVDGMARLPSLVLMGTDGEPVCGTAAERQAAGAPERVERTPKRRLGDRMLLLGDQAVDPVDLVAAVLRKVADEARRRQGGTDPGQVVLTHPAAWVGARLAALRDAARRAELGEVTLLPEPVAAAVHLADDRIETGDHVAVYDLGGGTFDAAILRRTTTGFEPVGAPGGDEHLGGEDFDELLYDAVGEVLAARDPERWELLRASDERTWVRANAALRDEVRAAKEALSSTPEYTIYVPSLDQEVRVTREEVEELVRPSLERSVDELVATVERAGLRLADVKAVYLVGGSSRIPLASRLISERTGLVPLTWGDPKAAVALGAAQRGAPADASPVVLSAPAPAAVATEPAPTAAVGAVTAPALPEPEPVGVAAGGGNGRKVALAAVAVAIVVALIALVAVLPGRSEEDGTDVASDVVPSTTTTTGPNGELEHAFPTSEAEGVRTERTWRHDPATSTLSSEVSLTNLDGSAPRAATLFEVIPKEVATEAGLVAFDPAPAAVVEADPVVRYDLTIPPGGSTVLRWTVSMPSDLDKTDFDAMIEARDLAEKAFFEKLSALGGGEVAAGVIEPGTTVPTSGGRSTTSTTNRPSTGGGETGGGSTNTTSTTQGDTTATTGTLPATNSTTTAPRVISAPGPITSVTASAPSLDSDPNENPRRVRFTLEWAKSGAEELTGYRVRCTTMVISHVYGTQAGETAQVPCAGGYEYATPGPDETIVVPVVDEPAPASSWIKWEVAAVNSRGTGPYQPASVKVPLVVGDWQWVGWARARVVGLRAEGYLTECDQAAGRLCKQDVEAGLTVSSGTRFDLGEQR